MLKKIVLVALAPMLSVSVAAAENPGKVGVVDFKTLIDSSETDSSAKSELKEDLIEDLEKMGKGRRVRTDPRTANRRSALRYPFAGHHRGDH